MKTADLRSLAMVLQLLWPSSFASFDRFCCSLLAFPLFFSMPSLLAKTELQKWELNSEGQGGFLEAHQISKKCSKIVRYIHNSVGIEVNANSTVCCRCCGNRPPKDVCISANHNWQQMSFYDWWQIRDGPLHSIGLHITQQDAQSHLSSLSKQN